MDSPASRASMHDVALSRCPHGFAPETCLICQTLAVGPSRASGPVEVLVGGVAGPRRRRLVPLLLAVGVAALGVVVVLAWLVALVWALARVAELAGVAVIFGYCGWKLGLRRGRRQGPTAGRSAHRGL